LHLNIFQGMWTKANEVTDYLYESNIRNRLIEVCFSINRGEMLCIKDFITHIYGEK